MTLRVGAPHNAEPHAKGAGLEVKTFFEDALAHGFQGLPHSAARTVDGDHGRIEVRRVWATEAIAWRPLIQSM